MTGAQNLTFSQAQLTAIADAPASRPLRSPSS